MDMAVVVKQCLSALHQLLAEPVVVPGAGCFEMCVCASLQQMLDDPGQYDCSRSQLMAALRIVQTAVLSAAGLRMSVSSPVAVDSVHRHAWLGRTVCRCKMVSASDVDSLGGSWRDVQCASEHGFLPEFEWFHPKPVSPKGVGEDVNVGLYCSKASALKTALESAVNLLSIGMVIQK
ncbi:uncharacterized protein LOC134538358 isoform X2 [Bacillus rossius redtenbacheri]|uniref:uncharacterized protein LOC134538358 isoform X2 n=1 Tax=Bacillus rossius redtenbacheri TaxID=93214 RepID=UPI002FDC96E3